MNTILKKDLSLYQIRKDIDNNDYLIFIKSEDHYYSQGFYTIKAAMQSAEDMIVSGRLK